MPFFTIENPVTAFGTVCTDGTLGYESHPFKILSDQRDVAIISAHAQSSLILHLTKRACLYGTLDLTMSRTLNTPCVFYINGQLLGHVYNGCMPTITVDLPPGSYRIEIKSKDINCAHSGWVLLPSTEEQELVTQENTLFTIWSDYPADANIQNEKKGWALKESSKIAGVKWTNVCNGQHWTNFYDCKILGVLNKCLEAKKQGKKYVLFADARDVIVRHSLTVLLGRLNYLFSRRFNKKIILAPDVFNVNHPVRDPKWLVLAHKNIKGAYVLNNSGLYFGKIIDIIEMQQYAVKAHDAVTSNTPFDEGTTLLTELLNNATDYKAFIKNDQSFAQLFQIMYPDKICLDTEKELFALTMSKPLLKNSAMCYSPVLTHTICTASLIHSPIVAYYDTAAWKETYQAIVTSQTDLQ
jgi:hypothetical protein